MEHAPNGYPSGNRALKALWLPDAANPGIGGRLTLTSGTPVTTSDVTGATAIYYEPYLHNRITLLDFNGVPRVYEFSRATLQLGTITSGKNYDVFGMWQNGAIRLEMGTAWTSDTARAEALGQTRGLYHRTGDRRKLYLGTFRTTATTTTEDSKTKRFLWNAFNRVARELVKIDSTDSWNYTTATIRESNAPTALGTNRVEVVVGLAQNIISLISVSYCRNTSTGLNVSSGIGVDSTTTFDGDIKGTTGIHLASSLVQIISSLNRAVPLGYHYYSWNERSDATGTTTWVGDGGVSDRLQSGLTGNIPA